MIKFQVRICYKDTPVGRRRISVQGGCHPLYGSHILNSKLAIALNYTLDIIVVVVVNHCFTSRAGALG